VSSDPATGRRPPDLDAWEAWTPWQAAERLADVDVPWCVVGGWAIDLFVGAQTREHGDLEVALLRGDFDVARAALAGFELFAAGSGEVRALRHDEAPPSQHHQVWVLDVEAEAWRIDVMLEPGDAGTWVFRRDESITAPRPSMVDHDRRGVPYLAPHGVLLYKAKAARDKDEADLATCLPRMGAAARTWLRAALERAHPEHSWLSRLT
jgi:hypothetical protein